MLSEVPDCSALRPILQTLRHPFLEDLKTILKLKIILALVTHCLYMFQIVTNSSDFEASGQKCKRSPLSCWSQRHLAKSKWATKQHLEHGSQASEHEKGQNIFNARWRIQFYKNFSARQRKKLRNVFAHKRKHF